MEISAKYRSNVRRWSRSAPDTVGNGETLVYVEDFARSRLISPDDVALFEQILSDAKGSRRSVRLLLHTRGGNPAAVIYIAKLLQKYAQGFTVYVPMHATSAGTILSLCAKEIVMGGFAALGPIDPGIQVSTHDSGHPVTPHDIIVLRNFLKDLLHGNRRGAVLDAEKIILKAIRENALLRVLKATDYVEKQCIQLLLSKRPTISAFRARRIVRHLLWDHCHHSHRITLEEARQIGLPVRAATVAEGHWMAGALRIGNDLLESANRDKQTNFSSAGAVAFSSRWCALYTREWKGPVTALQNGVQTGIMKDAWAFTDLRELKSPR